MQLVITAVTFVTDLEYIESTSTCKDLASTRVRLCSESYRDTTTCQFITAPSVDSNGNPGRTTSSPNNRPYRAPQITSSYRPDGAYGAGGGPAVPPVASPFASHAGRPDDGSIRTNRLHR
jgi:hypothetical protein